MSIDRGVDEVPDKKGRLLKKAFLLGAATDAVAVVPMLSEAWAKRLWGFEDFDGKYRYAMRFGAALMTGWTFLLLWAARRPVERRAVAPLTMVVVTGLAATEMLAVADGEMDVGKAAQSWALQTVLATLFIAGFIRARRDEA
jgi:hypothetical protein